MSWLEALIIGLVQGLTEFLPVSSSGHIEISKILFDVAEEDLSFTILLHAATALSTIIVFWRDIIALLKGLLQFKWNDETRFTFFVVISMIPAALVGILFKDEINALFTGNLILVGSALIATGFILYFSDKARNTTKEINAFNAAIIGIVQAISILPGISRSGSTIGTSILLGIDRSKAARFSFLMVLPLILGAAAKDFLDAQEAGASISQVSGSTVPYIIGFAAALLSGIFACRWMIALVKRSRLTYFAVYCWIIGGIGLAYALFS